MVNDHPAAFLFIGSDAYSKDKAIDKLRGSILKGSPKDLDIKIFRGSESGVGEILDHIRTAPLFSEKSIVLIKEAEKMDSSAMKILADAMKDIPPSTCLVLDSEDDSILKEHPEIKNLLMVKVFGELKGEGLLAWARDFVSAGSGKAIDKEAVRALSELKGFIPSDLACELEKLIIFTGDRKTITAKDVEDVVGRSVSSSAFDISWEIGKKDASGALRLVSGLMREGKRPHEIVGILSWHLKRVLRALVMRGEGRSDQEIARQLRIRRDEFEIFFRQLGTFGIESIKAKMEVLLSADLDIKRTRYDPGFLLEFAIIRLCLT